MMRDEARDALAAMIRDCGRDLVRMPASYEMYANQYLEDFPEEKILLTDAFKVGVPEKILQHAGEAEYASYLANLGPRFAAAAERSEQEAAWAVDAWARALNRTADYVPPARENRKIYPEDLVAAETHGKKVFTHAAMTAIVVSGGAIGAAAAALFFPIVLFAADLSAAVFLDQESGSSKKQNEVIIAFVLIGLAAASIGGLAALGGWLFGKGEEYPWATFSVACGTAFTMFFIFAFMPCVPGIVKPVLYFCSVFATTYKSAARGGNY